MCFLACLLAIAAPTDVIENDISSMLADDVPYVRYLKLDNIDEKERDSYMAVVSFVLNSLSSKKRITLPKLVDKNTIKFDIRDYGIDAKAYDCIGVDPYLKKNDVLKKITKSQNPVIRADWFIIKAMTAPTYYKLLGVSNLKEFRQRHGDDGGAKKVRAVQAAIVVLSKLSRNTRYIKRIATLTRSVWESRDSTSVDYLVEPFSEKYDSIQLLGFNPNGLISFYAADDKGNQIDSLSPDIAVDHSNSFEPDLMVRVSRNCFACHSNGVIPVVDEVRNLINKDIKLITPDKDAADKLTDLFGEELPVVKDQEAYEEAVAKTTGMAGKTLTRRFVAVWSKYYSDLTLEQAARELGKTPNNFKKECLASGQAHLVTLVIRGKIHRVHFEQHCEQLGK